MAFVFMTYAATLPLLRSEWTMSAKVAGTISMGFQFGNAFGLLLFSWLADRVGARKVFLSSACLSALTAVVFALYARSYLSGLVLYTLVALSQGGTYTTALMLIADRYPPERRGGAVGWYLASSSLGYACSLLLSGAGLHWGGYPLAFAVTACGPVVGMVLAWMALRSTPNIVHARPPGPRFGSEVLRNGPAMRLIAGYTFHSWELLGMWGWTPAFLAASLVVAGRGVVRAVEIASYTTMALHLVGLVASSSMGRLSDRLGRRSVLVSLAAISTACSFVFGWLIGWPPAGIFLVGAIYYFTALGDSPVLSTATTEAVAAPFLGSAFAFRSLVGFGAGAIAQPVFGAVLDWTNAPGVTPTTWGWAFVTLGLGGAAAAYCAYGAARDRAWHARPSAP